MSGMAGNQGMGAAQHAMGTPQHSLHSQHHALQTPQSQMSGNQMTPSHGHMGHSSSMGDTPDLNLDAPSDLQDFPELNDGTAMPPPPESSYPDKASLLASVQSHGKLHGYNVVVKSSSTPTEKKPGRTAKIWLRCDRGGHYRPRNGLTEETRKRKRTSRLMDCPFMLVAAGTPGIWSLTVLNGTHNHGPVSETPRNVPHHRAKKGQLTAQPYDWPHDASFSPFTTALVLIDMQQDCKFCSIRGRLFRLILTTLVCSPGGYLDYQGIDINNTRNLIPRLQRLLWAFRNAGFPVYHTREGKNDNFTLH